MNYEKAYNEALELAKAGKPIDEVFPELKESEDERIRKEIVNFICWAINRGSITKEQPMEWSEEDEKMVQFWNMYYEHKVGDWPNKHVVEHLERFKEWLNNRFKSLRPQPHWKPSEEQINALKVVARGFPADDPGAIDSLLTDLQKLL